MSVFSVLRYLRHGPLQHISWAWILLGHLYRFIIIHSGLSFSVPHSIGPYGPFRMLPEFAFSNFANWGQKHNRGFISCVELSKDKKCVFDVGAHIGLVTMPVSKMLGTSGQVIAFEPSAANCRALSQHLTLNNLSNVKVVNCLIGAQDVETVSFFESRGVSGMNTCAPIKNENEYLKKSMCQVTIDAFCEEHVLAPEIIKIDVEGYELAVLEGAKSILQKTSPTIFLSVHPKHLRALGRTTDELESFLDEAGYLLTDINGNPARPLQLDEYIARAQSS